METVIIAVVRSIFILIGIFIGVGLARIVIYFLEKAMETKEQCKNCEIINADCEGCKEFNKNIRNSDLEAKEQKIKRLKKEIKHEKEMIEVFLHYLPKNCDMVKCREVKIKQLEQELKELEE